MNKSVIPKDWSKVTLGQYVELELLGDYDKDPEQVLLRKTTEAHILTGLDVEEIDKLTIADIMVMRDLLNSKMPQIIQKRFKLKGIRYEVELNPSALNYGQFTSVLNLIRSSPVKNMHQVLFNICRPYKRRIFWRKYYDFKPGEVRERINDFKSITMDIANPIMVFFCNLSQELSNLTLSYLDNQNRMMQTKIKEMTNELLSEVNSSECTDG